MFSSKISSLIELKIIPNGKVTMVKVWQSKIIIFYQQMALFFEKFL